MYLVLKLNKLVHMRKIFVIYFDDVWIEME